MKDVPNDNPIPGDHKSEIIIYQTVDGRIAIDVRLVGKTSGKILDTCQKNKTITITELAATIGITERLVERNIQSLRQKGLLRRIGGRKEGHWEVIE